MNFFKGLGAFWKWRAFSRLVICHLRSITCLLIVFPVGGGSVSGQTPPANALRINEFMASNASTLADEDGDFSDWLEIYNPSDDTVQLGNWTLTDNRDEPSKWVMPNISLAPDDYTVVFASGKDRRLLHLFWSTVITWGDIWRYHVGTSAPPQDWQTTSFNDGAWAEGASGFGYGDEDDATIVDTTLSVYIRKSFLVDDADGVGRAFLDVDYDDGFVAYLNGVEIARANIGTPGVIPAYDETAGGPGEPFIASGQAVPRFEIDNPTTLLRDGENVLAIQVHNTSRSSSDITLIPFLSLGYVSPQEPPGSVAPEIQVMPRGESHANFQLSQQGEYLALRTPEGSITSVFDPYPVQSEDLSYGFSDGSEGYLLSATPGAANTGLVSGFVEAPVFSVAHGFYEEPLYLTLRSNTQDATIRYTLDGSEPTVSTGMVYTAPVLIEGSTILRAGAFKTGYIAAPSVTQTYLFLDDIAGQSLGGAVPEGWPRSWGNNVVDYGMDLQIVGLSDSDKRQDVKQALISLPSISLVSDLNGLFDSEIGIYSNATRRGRSWERPASAELLLPDGSTGFQINAGLRIRGGFSRNENNPKHAFRLFFRDEPLQYPLFGHEGVDAFENLDLRTSQNYSWSFHGDGRNTMNRDVFSRDAQRDMGMPYTRSRYYHVYLNGQYWGLFQSQERAEAAFGASYFGGNKDDFDVLKSTGPTDGFYDLEATDGNVEAWVELWTLANELASTTEEEDRLRIYQQMQGKNPDGTRNASYPVLLDVDNLINYMLVIFYSGNFDAPISWFLGNEQINNFYVVRDRTGDTGFQFFTHDSEHTLLHDVSQAFDRTGPFVAGQSLKESNPQWIHQQLLFSSEYRIRFADFAHQHLKNEGALTPEVSALRFQSRADEIKEAILAESARWGDSKREMPLTKTDWENAVSNISNNFFPRRSDEILNILSRTRGFKDWTSPNDGTVTLPLFPASVPPEFNQQAGMVASGFELGFVSETDSIFYTTDGSDPRQMGGAIGLAALYYPNNPLIMSERTVVKARTINNGEWSALSEAIFLVDASPAGAGSLVVSEVHYNPSPPTQDEMAAGFDNNDDFEYLELFNNGDVALDLTGVSFTEGITFAFDNVILEPGAFELVVRDVSAFSFRYGANLPIAGEYTGRLSNDGELIKLRSSPTGQVLHQFTYNDSENWPTRSDGAGSSLQWVESSDQLDDASSWFASVEYNGSPGTASQIIQQHVVINEVLTHTDDPLLDSIELYNSGTEPIDISGWFLSDDPGLGKFKIPAGTIITASGYIVFDESDFNDPASETAFALDGAHGDEVWLMAADASGKISHFSDNVSFGATENAVTLGRWPNGEGDLVPMVAFTPGTENAGPKVGPVIIRELMYHPPNNDQFLEYIVLYNAGASSESLDNWQLQEGVAFKFPAGLTLSPDESLYVLPFDPATEQDKIIAFDAVFEGGLDGQVVGPWVGRLNNAGEEIVLTRPDDPPVEEPDFIPQIEVDKIHYAVTEPWPTEGQGTGHALVRVNDNGIANDPENWVAKIRTIQPEPPPAPVDGFELTPVFPNPARESANFVLALEERQYVTINLYDVLGRRVRLLHEGTLDELLRHQFSVNGVGLASGVYFVQIIADRFSTTESFVMLP